MKRLFRLILNKTSPQECTTLGQSYLFVPFAFVVCIFVFVVVCTTFGSGVCVCVWGGGGG
eukprot:SAG11_NODE_2843_length_2915_cov_1.455966_1_plen_59_part_10